MHDLVEDIGDHAVVLKLAEREPCLDNAAGGHLL